VILLAVDTVRGVRIAFGTDDNTALTNAIVAKLKDMGHEVAVVADAIEWPEAGRHVGQAVASGAADRGVVCCWTGTGVAMAANKVPGVRAALCTDSETARGARRWNDANVLALSLRLTSPDVAGEMLGAFLATATDDSEQSIIRRLESDAPMAQNEDPHAPAGDRLTEWTSCGGCAAKWGAAPLTALVRQLAASCDKSLLVGLAPFDDAAVYRVSDDLAIVSTTDFFPPLVDDPADFGAIAAANACSDVFAMGGRVVMALNIAAFPERLPIAAIEAILTAAAATVAEAGGTIAGGHTIRSDEPIFGLAVQGLVHPDRVWTKSGARAGDRLVLSKPLGTGIVLAGGTAEDKAATIKVMRRLNREAAEALAALAGPGPDADPGPAIAAGPGPGPGPDTGTGTDAGARARAAGPHAVTDVTGYGLFGHGWEMAERSGVTLRFHAAALPLYPGALATAEAGTRTGGDARNRAHLEGRVTSTAAPALEALCYDPQTSGGLLAAVSAADAERLIAQSPGFVVIGEVVEGPPAVELLS
jgi:selenide,water dikinase